MSVPRRVHARRPLFVPDYRDGAPRAAAAAFDLHRQRDDVEAFGRELFEVGEVLEGGDVTLEEDAVRLEELRLAVVDARRVEPDGLDRALAREPARGVGGEPREVALG